MRSPKRVGKGASGVAQRTCQLWRRITTHTCARTDFLGDLLEKGITSIARLGGRSKVEALNPYNVRELAKASGIKFDRAEGRRYGQLMDRMRDIECQVEELGRRLERTRIRSSSWEEVAEHLRDGTPDDIAAFSLLDTNSLLAEHRLEVGGDNWQVVADGKRVQSDYLWKRWLQNRGAGLFRKSIDELTRHKMKVGKPDESIFNPWSMGKEEKQKLKEKWEKEMFSDERRQCARLLKEHHELQNDKQHLRQGSWSKVLQTTRVIGCTTTGAAIYKQVLDAAKASVIIIEEAGEVLEAHVLSSLQPETKHLILIGDHKQLRPKLEHYPLSVEAPHCDFNFNISLFERLIKSGMEHGTLQVCFVVVCLFGPARKHLPCSHRSNTVCVQRYRPSLRKPIRHSKTTKKQETAKIYADRHSTWCLLTTTSQSNPAEGPTKAVKSTVMKLGWSRQ